MASLSSGKLRPLDSMGSQAHLQVPVALQIHEGWSQHIALLQYLVIGGVKGLSDNKKQILLVLL